MNTVRATYKGIEVEILDVYNLGGGRKRCLVRALEGQPFDAMSHGGPMMTDSALVSPDLLTDIRQVEPRPARKSRLAGTAEQAPHPWRADGMEQYAAIFTVRHDLTREPWKGINSD